MQAKHKKMIGVGAGLVGAIVVFHKARQWWARHKLDQLREKAARGEIPTTQFLNAVIASGQPAPTPGAVKVTVDEAKRMSCAAIFPAGLSTLPEFAAALDELRRNGTCL